MDAAGIRPAGFPDVGFRANPDIARHESLVIPQEIYEVFMGFITVFARPG